MHDKYSCNYPKIYHHVKLKHDFLTHSDYSTQMNYYKQTIDKATGSHYKK